MACRLLLDASSLMYRAFHSVPRTVADASGAPVNAVHGYLEFTTRLIRDRHPDEVWHAFDHDWRPAPRVAIYAGYKAARPDEPEELTPQFALLRRVLAVSGMRVAEAPGWEAEDAIGTLVTGAGEGIRSDVVTGDRDLIQLVRDPDVRVLFTVKGVTELRVLDEAGVLAAYGVPASRYAEFAILRGDPSDGLPGVRGVGEKTARILVGEYPSLEAMVQDASRAMPRGETLRRSKTLHAAVRTAADYLDAMRDVVSIRTDLEVTSEGGAVRDDAALDELAERHRLTGPLRRLREALDATEA
jgi:5'-3' exonuclease